MICTNICEIEWTLARRMKEELKNRNLALLVLKTKDLLIEKQLKPKE